VGRWSDKIVIWRFLAIVACAALAQPSLAAHRGSKPAPHTEAPKGGSPGGPTTPPGGKAETDTADHDATSQGRIKGPGAESARKDSALHATPGPTPRIHLKTPDDGYINLRRRAARDSLVGGRKKLEIGRLAIAPHRPPAAGAVETRRTAIGVTVPANPAFEKHDALHPPATVPTGVPKNSLGLAVTEAHMPVVPHPWGAVATGVNGTTVGHTTRSSIGGAGKDRSAISGSSYHHR
jgi:hypothetical protein